MPRTVTVAVSPLTARLREAGFVHVTGLPVRDRYGNRDAPYTVQPRHTELSHWCCNNGMTVIVTVDGEVWLTAGICDDEALLREACPSGSGAFVPCSNGETIDFRFIMGRVADSYETFESAGGNYLPVPRPRN